MRRLALALVSLIIVMLIAVMARPEMLFELMESLTPGWLYAAAAMRVALGALLFGAARSARMPRTLKVLGVLFVLGGLGLPFVGVDNLRAIVDAIYGQDLNVVRVGMPIGAGFFLFIAYALTPRKEEEGQQRNGH